MIRTFIQFCSALSGPNRVFYFKIVRQLGILPGKLRHYEVACIHKSASTTCQAGHQINNERLEYLGDAILDAIVAEYLYLQFPDENEGFLTQLRAKIVKRKQLNQLAVHLGISGLLVANTHADPMRMNLLGNAFEALIGAMYLDKGYHFTRRFVIRKILSRHLDLSRLARKEYDFKSRIIEWAQKHKQDISFISEEASVPGSHETYFSSQVLLMDKELGSGTGHSKKDAEQKAAQEALSHIKEG